MMMVEVERSMRRMKYVTLLMMICICIVSSSRGVSSLSQPMCPPSHFQFQPFPILDGLSSHCPLSLHPNSLLQVNGVFFERALTSKRKNTYTAVLFYASWCPFSQSAHATFEVLSSMYPHIEHLTVEQNSAMPSLFSRYGIHSLPAIIMITQKSRTQFYGSKDLDSLIKFYKHTTGREPVQYIAVNPFGGLVDSGKSIMQSWIGSSVDEILAREPYLIFCVLFLFIRVLMYIIPKLLYRVKAIWASYRPHLNLEIFGETSQVLGRILHMIDVKGIWTKLRLCKSRNFHQGARNARVWASSLASVSLGETSTSRLSS